MLLVLIRHAHTGAVGQVLAGRAAGHSLDATGRAEAARLTQRLAATPLDAVYAGPLERARETAVAVAAPHALHVGLLDGVNEVDFGEWTGRAFTELDADPRWRTWNERRGSARVPGGESMLEAQTRAVEELEALASRHPAGVVAVVSHADIVRAALAWWLAMPLDQLLRLEIAPASTSGVLLGDAGPRVLWINHHDAIEVPVRQ